MKQLLYLAILTITFLQCTAPAEEIKDEKTLIDFFQPFKKQSPLVSEGTWGDKSVLPRDTTNGLEDATMKNWCYWDGSIVKDDEGKYHMYASRWTQSVSHSIGWNKHSKGMHSVSDNLYGPYKDLGEAWPNWKEGLGHNVVGLRMHDGRYALINSEVVPGNVFVSDSPYGPFEHLGGLTIDPNGYYPGWGFYNELDDGAVKAGVVGHLSNVMITLRPDGRYMMIARHCVPMISDDGILGPYKMLADKAWLGVKDLPQFKMEDPTVWYSDSLYHIVVNFHGADSTFHITSEDGIHNWKNRGLVFHKSRGIFKHNDGTIEDWFTVQRPTVYTEEGKVKAFNFSVIDTHKGKDRENDNHGSKVLVVPFDGDAFSKHIKGIVAKENANSDATLPPKPWQSLNIGSDNGSGNTGFDEEVNTIRVKTTGNKLDASQDAFRFVYQKMTGDVSAKVLVLSDEISGGPIQSGLMIRKSLQADAAFAFASFNKDGQFTLKQRIIAGEISSNLKTTKLQTPYWVRLEKRGHKVTCYVSPSNRMNWTKMGETQLKLGEEFYVGMAATSTDEKSESLARFKDVDIHSYGSPKKDGIASHTFPDTISASGMINFEVELESVKALDIWVELQNVQTLEKYKVLRKRCWKSGIHKLTYDAGKKLNPNNSYWFVIKAVPMHFHDSEHVDAGFKKVFVK